MPTGNSYHLYDEFHILSILQMTRHYGILWPNGSQSTMFGSWAISQGHRLSLYSPGGEDKVMTRSIVADLSILSVERVMRSNLDSDPLTVLESADFSGIDVLLVPNVDVLPSQEDEKYTDMLMNTFRLV